MNEQHVYSDEFKAQAVEMTMKLGATKAGVRKQRSKYKKAAAYFAKELR